MKKFIPWLISLAIVAIVVIIWWSVMEYALAVIVLIALFAIALSVFAGISWLAMFLGRKAVAFVENFISDSGWVKTVFGFLLVPTFGYLVSKLLGLCHLIPLTAIGTVAMTIFFFLGYVKEE